MSTPTNAELVGNIVSVLCTVQAFWPMGGCGALYNNALTLDALQTALIAAFPANGWDDVQQLTDRVAQALRQGTIIQCTSTDPPIYLLRLDAAWLSASNVQYVELCPQLYPPQTRENVYNYS